MVSKAFYVTLTLRYNTAGSAQLRQSRPPAFCRQRKLRVKKIKAQS